MASTKKGGAERTQADAPTGGQSVESLVEALRAAGVEVTYSPAPGGKGTATVGASGGAPSGHYWDRLQAATGAAQLDELRAELTRHGYAPDGQLMTAIAEKRGAKK